MGYPAVFGGVVVDALGVVIAAEELVDGCAVFQVEAFELAIEYAVENIVVVRVLGYYRFRELVLVEGQLLGRRVERTSDGELAVGGYGRTVDRVEVVFLVLAHTVAVVAEVEDGETVFGVVHFDSHRVLALAFGAGGIELRDIPVGIGGVAIGLDKAVGHPCVGDEGVEFHLVEDADQVTVDGVVGGAVNEEGRGG